ncbi:hypothetical protein T01_3929 [Trichinella spiralis]|uniref:Uncharacterized protein n=1 Tax=Trichinella spiralis TaxID=6334 RepID=A0A0V1BWB2_TRISP|nr:hypothetical protein T01_3929 [Trichinella spiralis]
MQRTFPIPKFNHPGAVAREFQMGCYPIPFIQQVRVCLPWDFLERSNLSKKLKLSITLMICHCDHSRFNKGRYFDKNVLATFLKLAMTEKCDISLNGMIRNDDGIHTKNVSTIVQMTYLLTVDDIEADTLWRFLTDDFHTYYYEDYE